MLGHLLLAGTFCGMPVGADLPSAASRSLGTPPIPHDGQTHFVWSRRVQQDKRGFYYQPAGLCEDYPESDRTQAKLDLDFQCLHQVGAKVLRVGIPWDSIERRPGQYHWDFWDLLVNMAVKNHVVLIPYVCYTPRWAAIRPENSWKQPPADVGDFQRFMSVITGRYKGKVHSWELWNEPDNQDFWLGSTGQYAALLRAGIQGVRRADPKAIVVLGGIADGWGSFFETLIRQYHVDEIVDVVNIHGYFETWNSHPMEDYPAWIRHVAHEVTHGPHRPDIWLAEFGYSSSSADRAGDGPHTPSTQMAALWKSHILAAMTGQLSLTAWYRIHDLAAGTNVIGDEENWHLGILDVQDRPKPAYFALRFYNLLFDQPVRLLPLSVTIRGAKPGVSSEKPQIYALQRKDGAVLLFGWLSHGGQSEEVSITLPRLIQPHLEVYNMAGKKGISQASLASSRLEHVMLTGSNVFIAKITPQAPPAHPKVRSQPNER